MLKFTGHGDRRFCEQRRIPRDTPTERLQAAVDAFLSRPGLSAQTRRSYRLTLAALTAALETAGAEPSREAIEVAARLRWGRVAPATWNRHAATVRSFLRYAARHRLLPELRVELDRRREPADRTRALPRAALERLWARRDVPLGDKTLWRLLYETAARAGEALSLNVEDLDALADVGTVGLKGWGSRAASAEASGRSWEIARRGLSRRAVEAIDETGTTVGRFTARGVRRGGTLRWIDRELMLRPASRWRERYALADGDRELAVFDGKGWGRRPVKVTVDDLSALDPGLLRFAAFVVRGLAEDASAAAGAASGA